MKKLILMISLLPLLAYAYIPSADFIFSKVVQNSGKGVYQIKQELSFQARDRAVTVTETWWVQSENSMFLKVEGPLFTQYYLYKNGKKYFFNSDGKFVSSSLPKDFYENLFFYRASQSLKESLISKKIIPVQIFKKRPVIKNSKEPAPLVNEPYLKLSRFKGSVTFLMGQAAQNEQSPGLWVEQDRFLIKKVRFPSQAEVSADTYSELSRGLIYPKTQTVSWDKESVMIELSRADAINKGTEYLEESNFSKLANQNRPLPQDLTAGVVADFYKRFR